MNNRDFYLQRRFFDNKHFPYGFARSGDFTVSESELLTKYGNLCLALMEGKVSELTSEDEHFTKAARGEVEPETTLEKVWLRYLKKSQREVHWLSRADKRRSSKDFIDLAEDSANDDEDLLLEA